MINIQDLRIGNLLQRIDVQNKMSPCTVVQIERKSFEVAQDGYIYDIVNLAETKCCPIPLTEQILLDNKFKHTKGSAIVIFEKDDFSVEIHLNAEHTFSIFYFKGKQIPCKSTIYVHDLQNAYYMATGQQLNIVIK